MSEAQSVGIAATELVPKNRIVKELAKTLGAVIIGAQMNRLRYNSDESATVKIERYNRSVDTRLRTNHYKRSLGLLEKFPVLETEFQKVYPTVTHWHGTGRYYEDIDGKPVDVLQGILAAGGLKPAYDIADHRKGGMESVSFALPRMYARTYAEVHSHGDKRQNYYGSLSFWKGVFGGGITSEMLRERTFGSFGLFAVRQALHGEAQSQTQREGIMSPQKSLGGSRVAANYPLLIGIRGQEHADYYEYRNGHEHRSLAVVPVQSFSHLEVPAEAIPATQGILAAHGIADLPVLPIEAAEEYVSRFSFSELASGQPLRG